MDISHNSHLPTPDSESDTLHNSQNLEQRLEASQSRMCCLLETLPQIVWLAQANGSVNYFNSRWYEYTGLTAEKSLYWAFLQAIHSEDRDRLHQSFALSLATNNRATSTLLAQKISNTELRSIRGAQEEKWSALNLTSYECRIRGIDGTYCWFIGQITPVRGEQDEILEWIGTYTPSPSRTHSAAVPWQTRRGVPWVRPSPLKYVDQPLKCIGNTVYEQGERKSSFSLFPFSLSQRDKVDSVSTSGARADTELQSHLVVETDAHTLGRQDAPEMNLPHLNAVWDENTQLAVDNQQLAQLQLKGQVVKSMENQAAQQHLRQLISKLSQAIVWEAEVTTNKFTFVSQSAERVLGYPVQQWLNEPDFWMSLIHPEDREWTVALCQKQRVQGQDYELVYRCRRADNQVIWLRDRTFVVRDKQGRIHKRRGLMVDITPLKQAELEFQSRIQSSSAIAQLTQQAISATPIVTLMNDAISLVSQTLQVEYGQILELLPDGNALKLIAGVGWSEGLIGNTLIDASVNTQAGYTLQTRQPVVIEDFSSESRFRNSPFIDNHNIISGISVIIPEASSVRVRERENTQMPEQEGQTERLTNILQQRPFSSPSSPSASSAPKTARPFGVLAAYTSRQRVFTPSDIDFLQSVANILTAAIQSQQSHAELYQVQAQLAQATVALEKSMREFDEFAYIASHDLKAPLRAIANLSEWIEEDICYQLNEENLHQLQLLRGRVHRLEVLLEGLLQYSRAGRFQGEPECVDVTALLRDILDTLSPPSEFTCEILPGMPVLVTQRLPLQQVFTQLIGNAIQHHPTTAGTVKISVQEQPEVYEFAITDNGAGIAPQFHKRVFDIFQTLGTQNREDNAGVGLAIAKKIVEGKGGTIRLESQEGRGATFYFTWPKRLSQV